MTNRTELVAGNERRHREGAARCVRRAREALPLIRARCPRHEMDAELKGRQVGVLTLRVCHPDKSIAELAEMCGLTKDAYWSALRRALLTARRIKQQQSNANRTDAANA